MGPLGPVVERAGALVSDDRYPDAATLRGAFTDAAVRLPPPEPLVLTGLAPTVDPDPTRAAVPVARLFDQDAAEPPPPDRPPVAPSPAGGGPGRGTVPKRHTRRDRKSTRLNSSHTSVSRMPSSA